VGVKLAKLWHCYKDFPTELAGMLADWL